MSQDGGPRMEDVISGLGEPERSILLYLLGRVRELEEEVEDLKGGTGAQDGLGDLAERVESLEEAVEGVGGGGLEETASRVDKLEEEVGEMRDDINGLQD